MAQMRIKQVEFILEGYFYPNSSFQERFTFTLEISDIANLKQAIEEIRQEFANQFGGNYRRLLNEKNELRREVEELASKLAAAKANWERTKHFLEVQGVKTDAPDFPSFGNYLLPFSQEAADAEFDEGDNDGISEYEM